MGDDGSQADIQFIGYFFIDKSFGYQYQYFYFAGRKIMFAVGMRITARMRCCTMGMSVGVAMRMSAFVSELMQLQDVSDQCFLVLINILGRYSCQLRLIVTVCQYNGLGLAR